MSFVGGYPGVQTAVKSGDSLTVRITADLAFDTIQVYDYQAAQAQTTSISAATTHDLTIVAAARGTGAIPNQTVQLRVQAGGGWSTVVTALNFHAGEGAGWVTLDNDPPVISTIAQANITYPGVQQALKGSEQAYVAHTITPSGVTVVYTSPNGELSISNSGVYETSKTVTRISGSYNVATPNFQVVATRQANGAQATAQAVVYVANTVHTADITLPYPRLLSAPAGAAYTVTITASQMLLSAPQLDNLTSGHGTWQGPGFTGLGTTWLRNIVVADSDSKGTFTFSGLVSTNLAGLVVSTISSGAAYVLGGFVSRTITVAAWPNREAAIGTQPVDTAKLVCYNNSKGASYLVTFQASTADVVDKFTLTTPSGVYNVAGLLFYNSDLNNAVANIAGVATFTISEEV